MSCNLSKNSNLGQVWTPDAIAEYMAKKLFANLDGSRVNSILDPACGPATFSKALIAEKDKDFSLVSFDIDSRFTDYTNEINSRSDFSYSIVNQDYLLNENLINSFDAIIVNPPYIRHEELENKYRYAKYLERVYGENLDKRSNIFAYFLLKCVVDLKPNGVMCAIVYDALKETLYGKKTLKLIDKYAEIISIEHFETPFSDAIVDANILLIRKRVKPKIKNSKKIYKDNSDFVPLNELLEIKRGISFIQRSIFIADKQDEFYNLSLPLFVKQGTLKGYLVKADKRAYLFESYNNVSEDLLFWLEQRAELSNKKGKKLINKSVTAPIIFNYYIRNNPRHLLNVDEINVSDNFYSSTPKNNFPSEVAWLLLNSDLYLRKIVNSGRSQGSGLIKLQLFEYKGALVPDWNFLTKYQVEDILIIANELLKNNATKENVTERANAIIGKYFNELDSQSQITKNNR